MISKRFTNFVLVNIRQILINFFGIVKYNSIMSNFNVINYFCSLEEHFSRFDES